LDENCRRSPELRDRSSRFVKAQTESVLAEFRRKKLIARSNIDRAIAKNRSSAAKIIVAQHALNAEREVYDRQLDSYEGWILPPVSRPGNPATAYHAAARHRWRSRRRPEADQALSQTVAEQHPITVTAVVGASATK
jgi:hypothetical protein